MASATEISQVRLNTGQSDNTEPYTDDYIGGLIDGSTVASATLAIWRSLAASYSTKVDVTEAGASHKFSDMFKHASAMAGQWQAVVDAEYGVAPSSAPRVTTIVRET